MNWCSYVILIVADCFFRHTVDMYRHIVTFLIIEPYKYSYLLTYLLYVAIVSCKAVHINQTIKP